MNEHSDSTIFVIIFTLLAFIILQRFFAEFFFVVWKWPMLFFLLPLIALPSFITNNILFFWTDKIPENAQTLANIWIHSPEYLYENYADKPLISETNGFIGSLIAPYLLIFIIYVSIKIYKSREVSRFRTSHTIDTLIRDQADLWPQIKIMVNTHPEEIADLDEGVWAMGLEPYKFAEKHGLIIKTENRKGEEEIRLDENKAIEVFQDQMGKPWQDIKSLSQEEKFVLSIMLLKANRLPKEATPHMKLIAHVYTTETKYSKKEIQKFKDEAVKKTDEILEKYANSKPMQIAVSEHFYVKTVMGRMLELARLDGVLTTADFIWLKIHNRGLWYMLNNIGRRAAWVECSGVWYHYNYEKAIKRKIPSPMISGAVKALDFEFMKGSESYIKLDGYNEDLE